MELQNLSKVKLKDDLSSSQTKDSQIKFVQHIQLDSAPTIPVIEYKAFVRKRTSFFKQFFY